jgi:Integrase core domain
LFDRICRENGITHQLTKSHSPTTTGKVEVSLQRELLDDCFLFASLAAAQAAIDGFVQQYNTPRPRQSPDMAVPADRFGSAPADAIGLRLPPSLTYHAEVLPETPARQQVPASLLPLLPQSEGIDVAVEVDRTVPASGNLTVCGQQFWFGPIHAGMTVTLRADTCSQLSGVGRANGLIPGPWDYPSRDT